MNRLASLVVASLLLAAPVAASDRRFDAPGPISAAAARAFPPGLAPRHAQTAGAPVKRHRDSLKNGAIIGAAVGAVTFAVLGSAACGLGDILSEGQGGSCVGGEIVVGAVGAGIGALIGAGVDALFEHAPYPGGGTQKGVKLHFRF